MVSDGEKSLRLMMYLSNMITRMAPTPSGYLHQGNLYNFLLAWLWARANGGLVLLRIDDADAERKRPEYLEDIFRVLEFIGLDWDIGPSGPDDFETNWSQRTRMDLYISVMEELQDKKIFYACRCTRSNRLILPDTGECSCLTEKIPLDSMAVTWRVTGGKKISFIEFPNTRKEVITEGFIARNRDGHPAYQLSSLADDRHFQVSHIVRGVDLIESTARQTYLDSLLGESWLNQVIFRHHSLLTLPGGQKLSKSAGHLSESLVKQINKKEFYAGFGRWMGWGETGFSRPEEMLQLPGIG